MLVSMNNYVSSKTETVEKAILPAKQTSRTELSSNQFLLHGERLLPAGRMHFILDTSVSPYTLWDEICTGYYYPGLRGTPAFKHSILVRRNSNYFLSNILGLCNRDAQYL